MLTSMQRDYIDHSACYRYRYVGAGNNDEIRADGALSKVEVGSARRSGEVLTALQRRMVADLAESAGSASQNALRGRISGTGISRPITSLNTH
jgi:hypothetical protein